jgi:membrane fusion protein (multidrug efflux system)
MNFQSSFIITLASLSFFSCKENTPPKAPLMSVTVTEVIQQDVPLFNEYVGQIYGLQDIPVRARVEGFLESIDFKEGRRVKKGQLLYTIDSQPFRANVATQEGDLARAKTELIRAQNDLKRIRPLAEANAVSKSDLDAAIADEGAAKAGVDAARANVRLSQIELGYCNLYSPINGVIGKTHARVGEFVGKTPNPVILNTVSKIESIRVQFFLNESQYLKIMRWLVKNKEVEEKEKEEKASLELILSDGSIHTEKGTIDFIDREVDASTGSILLQATFKNPNGIIRPGQFARVRANIGTAKDAILIPQKAIKEIQGKFSITVLLKGDKVERKSVEVGEKVGDYWIVTKGLQKGDKIIYEGFQKVRNGMQVKPVFKTFESQTNALEQK